MTLATDMTGMVFGELTAMHRHGSNARGLALWVCLCSCGSTSIAIGAELRSGHTKSCGCLGKRNRVEAAAKAHRTHGLTDDPVWQLWYSMMKRCHDTRHPSFSDYGGRGIAVCPAWWEFQTFYDDFGSSRPNGIRASIDRIDNGDGYWPGNVRWSDDITQANNRRSNRLVRINGRTRTVTQWSRETGVSRHVIAKRISRGLSGAELVEKVNK